MAKGPCHQDSEFFNTLGVLTSKLHLYGEEEAKADCMPTEFLTDQENEDLCKAFILLDVNGDGVIGGTEIESMLLAWGRLPVNEHLGEVMENVQSIGVEGTPGMSFEEFKAYVVKYLLNTDSEEELRECFQEFDTNPPTGKLNLIQLRDYMKNEGVRLTDDEIDFLYKEEDYWMLEDKPMFDYELLIMKILDIPLLQNKFLGC